MVGESGVHGTNVDAKTDSHNTSPKQQLALHHGLAPFSTHTQKKNTKEQKKLNKT